MNQASVYSHPAWVPEESESLDASDDFEPLNESRYCPTSLLSTFCTMMSTQGRCIDNNLMLGDREYAMWQLARAHAAGDSELRVVAVKLFSYFDDGHHAAAPH